MSENPQELEKEAVGEELNAAFTEDEADIVAEPKPPMNRGLLLLFGLVLAGIAGTYLMYLRSGPKRADAATVAQVERADATISTFLNAGGTSRAQMEQMLKETEKVVDQFLSYPSLKQIPLSALQTNPFRFLPVNAAAAAPDEALAKKKREEERQAMVKAVQQLQLQSVMHSDKVQACMIDNTLFREGQSVNGFTIEKINPQGVIVKNGAYRFELRMQQ